MPSFNKNREPSTHEMTVGKVGRKWALFDAGYYGRFDIETLRFDGGSHNIRIFFSEADYVLSIKRRELWDRIRKQAREQHIPKECIGVDQLESIVEILGA